MVFLPNVGIVQITDAIVLIKTDQKPPISYRDISGHREFLSFREKSRFFAGPVFFVVCRSSLLTAKKA
jgi:hypothetical protein